MKTTEKDKSLHFKKVMNFLNNDRKTEKRFCNKTLCSQGQSFAIHDGVLASMSDYFNALFGAEMREKHENLINIDKISPKQLGGMIDYIYTGEIELTEENVFEVLEDADYMLMTDLKAFCGRAMLHTVSANNCLKMRAYASRYNLSDVEIKTIETIVDNITAIIKQTDFMLLDAGDIAAICKQMNKGLSLRHFYTYSTIHPLKPGLAIGDPRNNRMCNVDLQLPWNIEALFTGLVLWVNFNPSLREELFVNLFSLLDLSLFSNHFLMTVETENLVKKFTVTSNAVMDETIKRLSWTSSEKRTREVSTAFLVIGGLESERDCMKYYVYTKQHERLVKLNADRIQSSSAKVGNKIYVMGGRVAPFSSIGTCEMINLEEANDTWRKISNMLVPRAGAGSTVIQEQIFLTGGGDGPYIIHSACSVYDVNEDRWGYAFDMLEPRCNHGSCSIGGSVYCIGGRNRKQRLSSCERCDPRSGKSSQIAPLKKVKPILACVATEEAIYAIGGSCSDAVEVYNPRVNRWRSVSPLLQDRSDHCAAVVDGQIYAIGGVRDRNAPESVEVYDPTSDCWTHCFDLEKRLCGATVVAL